MQPTGRGSNICDCLRRTAPGHHLPSQWAVNTMTRQPARLGDEHTHQPAAAARGSTALRVHALLMGRTRAAVPNFPPLHTPTPRCPVPMICYLLTLDHSAFNKFLPPPTFPTTTPTTIGLAHRFTHRPPPAVESTLASPPLASSIFQPASPVGAPTYFFLNSSFPNINITRCGRSASPFV